LCRGRDLKLPWPTRRPRRTNEPTDAHRKFISHAQWLSRSAWVDHDFYFQYGTTTSYGHTTIMQGRIGNLYQSVSANISGLSASTTYHFRIVAVNNAGTVYGADRTFTTLSATGAPVVITNPATNVTSSSATLNGTVDPHGLTTTVYFQYGTTTSY